MAITWETCCINSGLILSTNVAVFDGEQKRVGEKSNDCGVLNSFLELVQTNK